MHKFDHWSEVLSVLTYNDSLNASFIGYKSGGTYVDPLSMSHFINPKGSLSHDDVLVVNGSIHLETFPLSKGKIPYSKIPYKVAIEHTTGYSPWDFLQMVELAEISEKGDPEFAQGSKVLYLMNKKCYSRFISTDWKSVGKDYYESWKPRITNMVDKGYVLPTAIEPAQFWLEERSVNHEFIDKSDHLCLCLNWCNIDKVKKAKLVVDICKKLHDYTGKDIDIRLHSYSREGLFHILSDLPYVHLILLCIMAVIILIWLVMLYHLLEKQILLYGWQM